MPDGAKRDTAYGTEHRAALGTAYGTEHAAVLRGPGAFPVSPLARRSAVHEAAIANGDGVPTGQERFEAARPADLVERSPTRENPVRPLRVIHVGTQFVQAGIDNWLSALVRYADPARLHFQRCIVTTDMVNYGMAAELPAPVVVGGRESVRQAVDDCDILLMAGPPALGEWLAGKPPRLGVFVAHGVCNWTRTFLDGCLPVVDHVVAVSPMVQRLLCGDVPSTVIPNGVDARRLAQSHPRDEVRAAYGFGPDDFVLGFIGRLSEEKRPEALIEAVARLPRRYKLLIVGWGGLRGELLELANRMIPGRFAFGDSDQPVGDYYAAMDAFCLASEYEGFGLVILEAMVCGKPVITTPVGFVSEALIDRVNVVVVEGSPESIAAVARMIDDHPDWARGIAAEGRRYAERHGYAGLMADRYADLLERLWVEKQGESRNTLRSASRLNGKATSASTLTPDP